MRLPRGAEQRLVDMSVSGRGAGWDSGQGMYTGACELTSDRAAGPAERVALLLAALAADGAVPRTSSVADLIAASGIVLAERGAPTVD